MTERLIVCRRCSTAFAGRYNATVCPDCRAAVRRDAQRRFRERNPDYWKTWASARPAQHRRNALMREYGITVETYEQMHSDQQGRCAICSAQEGHWEANAGRLVVDHCHTTGTVRGLLCPPCNRGLGQFEDDPARLQAAAAYVAKIHAERVA